MKNKQSKCDNHSVHSSQGKMNLHQASCMALDQCSLALQCIIKQQKLMKGKDAPFRANVLDAKKDLIDAMVNLATAYAGGNYEFTKCVLSHYGLEDMI